MGQRSELSNFLGLNINDLRFTQKSENKKIAEYQRLNVLVGQRSELSNFLKMDIALINTKKKKST